MDLALALTLTLTLALALTLTLTLTLALSCRWRRASRATLRRSWRCCSRAARPPRPRQLTGGPPSPSAGSRRSTRAPEPAPTSSRPRRGPRARLRLRRLRLSRLRHRRLRHRRPRGTTSARVRTETRPRAIGSSAATSTPNGRAWWPSTTRGPNSGVRAIVYMYCVSSTYRITRFPHKTQRVVID